MLCCVYTLIFPYPSGLLHWHCGNLTIAPVPAKQPWWIWINTSCEFIMNDCITTTKQSTTKPCAYFLGYTVCFRFSFDVFTAIRFFMILHFGHAVVRAKQDRQGTYRQSYIVVWVWSRSMQRDKPHPRYPFSYKCIWIKQNTDNWLDNMASYRGCQCSESVKYKVRMTNFFLYDIDLFFLLIYTDIFHCFNCYGIIVSIQSKPWSQLANSLWLAPVLHFYW